MNPQFEKRHCRPREHLITAGKLYSQAWSRSDEFRADRGRNGLPDWPQWCYLPMSAWYAIVSADAGVDRLGADRIHDVARLAAIGSWRVTQGIYRFDPALYAAVVDTPITGDIPCDILYRLPEWCVYVETPGIEFSGAPLHGVWAHLECDANTDRAELRLLTDGEAGLMPIILHLGTWSLAESIERAVVEAVKQGRQAGLTAQETALASADVVKELRPLVEPVMSLLLYICSENSEIGNGSDAPKNPEPKRTKRGWRLFAPDKPTTWDVGVRLGTALRRAYYSAETDLGDTHAGPRPHIRRAHWHGFRSGPMKRADGSDIPAGQRKFDLRWLPPIPVNLHDVTDLPATIRPVKP